MLLSAARLFDKSPFKNMATASTGVCFFTIVGLRTEVISFHTVVVLLSKITFHKRYLHRATPQQIPAPAIILFFNVYCNRRALQTF